MGYTWHFTIGSQYVARPGKIGFFEKLPFWSQILICMGIQVFKILVFGNFQFFAGKLVVAHTTYAL